MQRRSVVYLVVDTDRAHLILDNSESLRIDLKRLDLLKDDLRQHRQLIVISINSQQNPIRLRVERITQSSQLSVVRIFGKRISNQFGEEAGFDRVKSGVVDER